MKRSVSIVFAIMLVFGIIMARPPLQVQAKPITPNPLIAGGSWSTGSNVDVSELAATAPTWLQLLTGGVKITEAGKICHPFRGGQFGWIGEIRQYINGTWIKIPTLSAWVPNTEGEFMACAQAPMAGTYALFGYYITPEVVEVEIPIADPFDCSAVVWSSDKEDGLTVSFNEVDHVWIGGQVTGISSSAVITYEVIASNNTSLIGPKGEVEHISGLINNFDTNISSLDFINLTILFRESDHGCTHTRSIVVS